MEIESFEQLMRSIQIEPERMAELIKKYGDRREEHGINEGWKRSRLMWTKALKNRSDRLRKEVLNYDEYTGVIEVPRFTDYFAAIEEELKFQMEHASDEGRKIAESIHDLMWDKLGNVRIDKRQILPFRNEEPNQQ